MKVKDKKPLVFVSQAVILKVKLGYMIAASLFTCLAYSELFQAFVIHVYGLVCVEYTTVQRICRHFCKNKYSFPLKYCII